MCWKKKKKAKRAKYNHYSATAIDNKIRDIRKATKELESKKAALGKHETTSKLVYPFLDAFGWKPQNIESQSRVGDTRKRADIALLDNDKNTVAIVDVLKFGEKLNNEAAIEMLTFDAVNCGVHLAVLTNGKEYRFYSVNTEVNTMERYLDFKITRIGLKNKNAALVEFFTFESFNAYALYTSYTGDDDM